jgi:DNA (cytosine-5)-methyltransferase 1
VGNWPKYQVQQKNHVDTTKPTEVTHLSLCTGYGGIDLGLRRCIPSLRTIAYAEIEASAIELLLARMEGGSLDAAPIWTNLRTFPWGSFSGRVDILSGGYPCQPFSAAGKRLGADDERHLWPAIAAGIRILRPRLCFFENVEGHISLGLREVIEELEGLGYRTAWGIFSAAEVGAPHQRKRVFIMAHRKGEGLEGHRGLLARCSEPRWHAPQSQGQIDGGDSGGDAWPSRPGEPQYAWEPPRVVADTGRDQRERRSAVGEVSCEHDGAQGAGEESDCRGQDEAGEWEESESGGIGAEPAVGDTSDEGQPQWGCGEVGQPGAQSEPQRPSGNSDHAECQAEPPLGGGADGPSDWMDYAELCYASDNRTDELRMLGNGVVPATAAKAFETLMKELL